jgi:GWxTD domain-containing protein
VTGRCAGVVLAGLSLAACGSWQRVGTSTGTTPEASITQVLDMGAVYRQLGRLVAPAPLPFIGNLVYAAGPGDSSIVMLGLSFENRVFSFQREDNRFVARYHIDIRFEPASGSAITVSRDEVVQVGSFRETMRNEESVLFQQVFHLLPGSYKVSVSIKDRGSSEQSRVESSVEIPGFGANSFSAPLVAYEVTGRAHQSDPLNLVLNPRGTVAYGSDTLLAYIEGYQFSGPTALPFEIHDATDSIVYQDSLRFAGNQDVEGQVIRLTPDSAPLGELRLIVGSGSAAKTASAIVSLSTAWVVTNYEEMVTLLRYFGYQDKLDSLRKAPPSDRSRLWRAFYVATDPIATTPENEALDLYFQRLAIANGRFRDEGTPGWRTDRGEVYIMLGEPDEVYDSSPLSQGRIIRWVYVQDRLQLTFVDETGFGRFRLTTSARAEFDRVVDRHRRQGR